MPFTPYKSVLDPEAMAAAQEAFDMGLAEMQLDRRDKKLVRDILATRIVKAALEGERDPERLKVYALEGFKQRQQA